MAEKKSKMCIINDDRRLTDNVCEPLARVHHLFARLKVKVTEKRCCNNYKQERIASLFSFNNIGDVITMGDVITIGNAIATGDVINMQQE